jgi:hypothetical protein
MLALTELVGVPQITLGGRNDEEIIGNLMSAIGMGGLILLCLALVLRFYLPRALRKRQQTMADRAAKPGA